MQNCGWDRRDVTLHEDSSRMRRGNAPHVVAALNNTVIEIVAEHGATNLANVQREFQYQLDRALLHQALQTR